MDILSQFQVPNFNGLGVKVFWNIFPKRMFQLLNQLMGDKGVCRTDPATPGLLINIIKKNGVGATISTRQDIKRLPFACFFKTINVFFGITQKVGDTLTNLISSSQIIATSYNFTGNISAIVEIH